MNDNRVLSQPESAKWIAERTYAISHDGQKTLVTIRLSEPLSRATDARFECIVTVKSGNDYIERRINGDDTFEALFAATVFIGIELGVWSQVTPENVHWHGQHRTGMSFPLEPAFSLAGALGMQLSG